MRPPSRLIANVLVLFLALAAASHGKSPRRGPLSRSLRSTPPAQAAAAITPNAGACVQFISVFVPAQGGEYVVGVSFSYRDMNWDGHYTPGIDRLDVCVNCADACGWGP